MALADLLLLGSSGTNILLMISHRTLLWSLSDLSCTIIPYIQTIAVLVGSLTLGGIAIDRYAAIKSKYPLGTLCLTDRNAAVIIYTALFAVIFLPLGAIFIFIHLLLVLNIFNRKSPGDKFINNRLSICQDGSTASTNVGKYKTAIVKKNATIPTHIIRKRRTVRVILILIIIFAICRLPQWSFLLVKLHVETADNFWWNLQVVLTTLSLFNASIHPFLYAFLNESLSLVKWIKALCCIWKRSMSIINNESQNIRDASFTASAIVPRGPYNN
ncbi:hypothetical protein PV326_012648 [Microctonus aethiopoides]|nr:hypothetical protein PV326_012648 [Microctonus aethiopoides]